MQVNSFFKSLIALVLIILISVNPVNAQRTPKKRTTGGDNNYNNYSNTNNYGNNAPKSTPKADTTKKSSNQQNNNYGTQPAGNNNYGSQGNNTQYSGIDTTLPIEVIKSSGGGGLTDSTLPSLRNDAAVDLNMIQERAPLDYESIREDDAIYRVRVWREIDAREKINQPFRYAAEETNGGQRFINILIRAITQDSVTAFSAENDRFTTPITPEEALSAFGGSMDTVARKDDEGNVIGYQIRPHPVEADSIYKFRIKEEWIFDKETSRMFVRILGIAPVIPYRNSLGEVAPNSDHPTWWIYYPDLRPVLAKNEAYNPKNMGARMTWEELFENRMFSSYITKSTIDNPYDQTLKQIVNNNQMFSLYEGENVKDKIFNYEQSLWSY